MMPCTLSCCCRSMGKPIYLTEGPWFPSCLVWAEWRQCRTNTSHQSASIQFGVWPPQPTDKTPVPSKWISVKQPLTRESRETIRNLKIPCFILICTVSLSNSAAIFAPKVNYVKFISLAGSWRVQMDVGLVCYCAQKKENWQQTGHMGMKSKQLHV